MDGGEEANARMTSMNRSRKLYISIIVPIFLFFSINFQAGGAGTNSLFELPLDARSLAMGKVSVSLGDRITDTFYSPAGSNEPGKSAVSSLYANHFGELHYATLSLRSGGFGVSYRRLGSGKLTERDLWGNPTGNSFRYYSQGLVGRIGRSFGRTVLGIKGRILQKQIGDGFLGGSLSPEVIYELSPIRFGAVISNLVARDISGSEGNSNAWNRELILGLGFERDNFRAGFDVEAEFHDRGVEPNGFRAGVEWWITRFAALRLGIMDQLRHTIGWGIRRKNIQIDYAYLRHGDLPNSHFVSFSWII
ncbi:hypothetical protein K9M78_04950 [Candidatus Bipolaricaulota bacterium]|nr:hypothetical protein [Candidatus Bipolaricaulota bacterium]